MAKIWILLIQIIKILKIKEKKNNVYFFISENGFDIDLGGLSGGLSGGSI